MTQYKQFYSEERNWMIW